MVPSGHQVKRNLLSVSYHITQYTDVISDLRGQIQCLKAKVERQERERRGEPGGRDAQGRVGIPAPPPWGWVAVGMLNSQWPTARRTRERQ